MECNEWNDLNEMEWNGMEWYVLVCMDGWMDERMNVFM